MAARARSDKRSSGVARISCCCSRPRRRCRSARATAAGHALYDLANAGTRFTLALEWSLGLNNSLTFEIGNAVLAPSSKPVNGPAGQQYQFEVSAEPDDAEEDDAFFVATLKNQIASYALPDWS